MARVSADAAQARRDLQDAASLTQLRSAGPTDEEPGALPMRLASISANETEQLNRLRLEVYVGFWEITVATAASSAMPVPASAP
eukprot:7380817-Prymnesium_polylepis.1